DHFGSDYFRSLFPAIPGAQAWGRTGAGHYGATFCIVPAMAASPESLTRAYRGLFTLPATAPFSRKNNHMLQFILAVPMALATIIGIFSQEQKQGSSPEDGGLHDTITILQTADIHGQIMPH